MKKESTKKDRLGIIAEDINSKFGLVIEGVSVLTKQIKNLDAKIDNFQTETNSKFETVFDYLSASEKQNGKIERLDERVMVIEKHLAKVK